MNDRNGIAYLKEHKIYKGHDNTHQMCKISFQRGK